MMILRIIQIVHVKRMIQTFVDPSNDNHDHTDTNATKNAHDHYVTKNVSQQTCVEEWSRIMWLPTILDTVVDSHRHLHPVSEAPVMWKNPRKAHLFHKHRLLGGRHELSTKHWHLWYLFPHDQHLVQNSPPTHLTKWTTSSAIPSQHGANSSCCTQPIERGHHHTQEWTLTVIMIQGILAILTWKNGNSKFCCKSLYTMLV